jgi:hypothetical protein
MVMVDMYLVMEMVKWVRMSMRQEKSIFSHEPMSVSCAEGRRVYSQK